jgi:hypothetical protein
VHLAPVRDHAETLSAISLKRVSAIAEMRSLSIRRSGWQADHMQIVARCRPGGSPCLTERMPHPGTKRCKRISIA